MKEKKLRSYIENLKFFGLNDSEYIKDVIDQSNSLNDAVWALFNKALAINADDFNKQSNIYYSMARFTVDEGKDPSTCVELALEAQLNEIECRSSNITLDVIIVGGGNSSCSNCSHLNDRVMTINEARELCLLPYKPCNYDYCTGMYCGKGRRDIDGFIIPKAKDKNQRTTVGEVTFISKLLKLFK